MKVGLIGCGRIAFDAHLPAYRKYNVEVVAVCDIIEQRAKKAAETFNIPSYFVDALELAAHPDVELLDIATPPQDRITLLRSLYSFKKPMLIQKPLSYDYETASLICDEFDKNNLLGAVNHNARWAPVSIKLSQWIKDKRLGEVYQIHHVNRFNENLQSWYTDVHDYLFLDHGLHYFDLIRAFSQQMPSYVSALSNKKPGQIASCPLTYSINLKFNTNIIASLYFNNAAPAPHSFACNWFVDGSLASAHATIDSISCYNEEGVVFPQKKLLGDWVPEGFWGSYKSFVDSMKSDKIPPHSLKDHLKTLKIAVAAAKSAAHQGEWIEI